VSRLLLIAVFMMLAACAAQPPIEEGPELITNEREITLEMIKKMLSCAVDRTPVCLERMGKPYRCFCADTDSMRQVLEPDKFP
jgi:hypothetical protein